MASTIYREEIIRTRDGEQFEVESRGELRHMPTNARSVWAVFGMFERTPESTLLYTLDADGIDIGHCDSLYLDDLAALRAGRVQIADRR